jgi:biotin carboxyl carrier protein
MNCASPASLICRISAVPVLVALAVAGCLTPAAPVPARAGPVVTAGAPELRAGTGTGPSPRELDPRLVTVGAPGTGGRTSFARDASPPGTPAGPAVGGDGLTADAGHGRAAPDPDASRAAGIGDGVTAKAPEPDASRGWPVGAPRPLVVRGWEPPSSPYGPGHRGVDLAAAAGTPVRAAASGTVSFAGSVAGRGVLTITLTGTGDPPLRTTYEPVRPLVEEGTAVTAGQVVATVEPGASHCRGCLHWGLRRGTTYLDPLTLLPPWMLRRGPSRLLPVFEVPGPRGTVTALSPTATAGAADLLHAALLLAGGVVAHRALRSRPRCAGAGTQFGGRGHRDTERTPATDTRRGGHAQPRTPRSTMATAASAMASGSSAAPSSIRRTAASTTP